MSHNLHEIIKKYSLPVRRGEQSVSVFLNQYFNSFIKDLEEMNCKGDQQDFPTYFYESLYKTHLQTIKKECTMILDIIKLDQNNWQSEKRKLFDELMILLIECGAFRKLNIKKGSVMSRIRSGNGPFERKEVFHVPFTQRQLSPSQRFSIPGNPCLYLSAFPESKVWQGRMFELSWMESGMPKVFNACFFETQKELVFLHFAKKGSTYLAEYKHADTKADQNDRLEAIMQYLLTFPMRAACFISVEDKHMKKYIQFYEEYVFPQLLMEWIQKNRCFDGVTYQSATSIQEARELTAYNIAMPIREVDPIDGYDLSIKKCFKLSIPQKIDLTEDVKVVDDDISEVLKYAKELEEKLIVSDASNRHPYYLLLELCHSLCFTYGKIKNKNEANMLIHFQQLCWLCSMSMFISKTIEHVCTADEWINLYRQNSKDNVLTTKDYDEVLKRFQKINTTIYNLRNVFHLSKFNHPFFIEPKYDYIDV